MTIRRSRVDRTLPPGRKDGEVMYVPAAWSFSLTCPGHQQVQLDFNVFRAQGRESLAAHVRDAFWSLRNKASAASFTCYINSMHRFWRFLDDEQNGVPINRLDQIDRACIDRFLTWLDLLIVSQNQPNAGKKLSVGSRRQIYGGVKTILIDRQIHAPHSVSPALTFPLNPFPNANRLQSSREPYSDTEYRNVLRALNEDLHRLSRNEPELPDLQVLTVYLLSIAAASGANLQPLLELTEESLTPHALSDREVLTLLKRRGWTTFSTSIRRSDEIPPARRDTYTIPRSIGDHVRALAAFSTPLRPHAQDNIREFLFLWRVSRGDRKGQVIQLTRREVKTGIRDFAHRHKLLDDSGHRLALSFGRFRPTFANQLYSRTHDIRSVSQALGHANVEVTARKYLTTRPEAIRDHAIVAESLTTKFTQIHIGGKTVVAADGAIPLQDVTALRRDGYATGIAHCANPFREEDSVCKKFFTCFRCPNLVILEDDLWRLFSFYYRLLTERHKLRPEHWMKTYAPIIRRIDDDIVPLFPHEKVLQAKRRARMEPHPAWR